VTTAVDPEINDKFHVLPGIGNFGDRKVDYSMFCLKTRNVDMIQNCLHRSYNLTKGTDNKGKTLYICVAGISAQSPRESLPSKERRAFSTDTEMILFLK
jgi:hypothetical protein